jgi:hypothetical protein
MDEIDELFQEASRETVPLSGPQKMVEEIVRDSESEFRVMVDEERSRQSEEKEIKEKIVALQKKLRQYPNIRNPRLTHLNSKRSEMRKKIKTQIAECNLRLQEIKMERGEKS